MTLKAVLIDPATGVAIEVIDDIFGHPNLAVTDHYPSSTRFRSSTRTGAGTTTIAEPAIDGAIMLTDMIISTDRVALSRLTVFFDDGPLKTWIYEGMKLETGNLINGPAIIEEPTTTVVIPPECRVEVDAYSNYVMTVSGEGYQ